MNPQVLHTLQALGFVFVLLLLVALVHVVGRPRKDEPNSTDGPTPPPNAQDELINKIIEEVSTHRERIRERERLQLAATIAAGIASGVGRGIHSTEIAADALRIANEIIEQSSRPSEPIQHRSILEWLQTLPSEIREKAIQNTAAQEREETRTNLYLALKGAFIWRHSPEGHDYWRDIANQYKPLIKKYKNE